jgi:hypothetical protein
MSDPRTFISFDYDNNSGEKLYFAGQTKNSRTPFNISDWSNKESLAPSKWEEETEEKIKKCNLMIVLVGKSMGTATGVKKEIAFAKKNDVPIFGVYVGGADSNSNLPDGLQRNRTIDWGWTAIASAITQMMGEGKNK